MTRLPLLVALLSAPALADDGSIRMVVSHDTRDFIQINAQIAKSWGDVHLFGFSDVAEESRFHRYRAEYGDQLRAQVEWNRPDPGTTELLAGVSYGVGFVRVRLMPMSSEDETLIGIGGSGAAGPVSLAGFIDVRSDGTTVSELEATYPLRWDSVVLFGEVRLDEFSEEKWSAHFGIGLLGGL